MYIPLFYIAFPSMLDLFFFHVWILDFISRRSLFVVMLTETLTEKTIIMICRLRFTKKNFGTLLKRWASQRPRNQTGESPVSHADADADAVTDDDAVALAVALAVGVPDGW